MPERTLTAALEAAREVLIDIALDDIDPPAFAAQAYGVVVLTRLATDEPEPGPTAAEAERAERDGAIIAAAVVLVEAVSAAELTSEHFTGVYEPLLAPLADLGFAVEAPAAAKP